VRSTGRFLPIFALRNKTAILCWAPRRISRSPRLQRRMRCPPPDKCMNSRITNEFICKRTSCHPGSAGVLARRNYRKFSVLGADSGRDAQCHLLFCDNALSPLQGSFFIAILPGVRFASPWLLSSAPTGLAPHCYTQVRCGWEFWDPPKCRIVFLVRPTPKALSDKAQGWRRILPPTLGLNGVASQP
jgi:hypothetical protein